MENAQQLLLDCSIKAVEDYSSEMREYMQEDDLDGYEETVKDARKTIEELRPLLKEWSNLCDKIDEEMTHDGNRHEMERAASYMLVKWASVVSSKW